MALVIGVALLIVLTIFQLVPRLFPRPCLGGEFVIKQGILSKDTLLGAVIFGLGWGISGLCPGTAFAALGMGNWPVALGIVAMFLGALLFGIYKNFSRE